MELKRDRFRLNRTSIISAALFSLLFYGFYFAIIYHVAGFIGLYVFLSASLLILLLLIITRRKLTIPYRNIKMYAPFLIMAVVCITYNKALPRGDLLLTFRIVICTVIMLFLSIWSDWLDRIMQMILVIGIPNAIATILFWVLPGLYTPIATTLVGDVNAPRNKEYTYGIANFYSENGTFITICLLTLWIYILKEKKNKLAKVFFFICLYALLLTSKRAHLLFSIAAMIIVYLLENPKKFSWRVGVAVIVGTAFIIAFFVVAQRIAAIQLTIDRLMLVGTADDVSSNTRFSMWGRAIEWFKESPIFGKGFFFFRYANQTFDRRFRLLNCHNVFFQLLCETGVVGFAIYIYGIIKIYSKTIRLYIQNRTGKLSSILLFSVVIQSFILLYHITGNCYYDVVFVFYSVSLAICGAVESHLRKNVK